ncbi:MAG: hypothetical protein NVS3B20_02900 [Polyangiales bacterium]
MFGSIGRWFGYGVGAAVGRKLLGDDEDAAPKAQGPIRTMTEEEIRADEKRYDEDEKRLDANSKRADSAGSGS